MKKPSVFISSSAEGLSIAQELASLLAPTAECNIWASSIFKTGQTIIESFTESAALADFGVIVLTPDDRTEARGETFQAPRDNLIFELGFLAGSLGISRTIIVVVGEPLRLKLPSDLSGVLYLMVPSDERGLTDVTRAIEKAIHDLGPTRAEKSIDFYSCFISYSWDDKRFARLLHDDLQEVGVRCWLDEKDLRPGDSLTAQIDRGIQVHDKVLLVLSQASIESGWVNAEIQHALTLESARDQTILFPVRLDDAIMTAETPNMRRVREKLILDFRDWQNDKSYQRAFSRLVRGLALSASVESGGHS